MSWNILEINVTYVGHGKLSHDLTVVSEVLSLLPLRRMLVNFDVDGSIDGDVYIERKGKLYKQMTIYYYS